MDSINGSKVAYSIIQFQICRNCDQSRQVTQHQNLSPINFAYLSRILYIHHKTIDIIELQLKQQTLMEKYALHIFVLNFFFVIIAIVAQNQPIPTTLQGPFEPVTRRFDPSLRTGSDDLPMDHPRLKKNVTSIFPEQIALAISSPTSMWVSWVTGTCFLTFMLWVFSYCVALCCLMDLLNWGGLLLIQGMPRLGLM